MKKYVPVLLMLGLPTATLLLLFKGVVYFVVTTTPDYALIGQRISQAVPYVLMLNHSIALLILLIFLRHKKMKFKKLVSTLSVVDLALGLFVGLVLFGLQQIVLLPLLTQLGLYEFRGGFPGYAYFVSAVVFAGMVEEWIYRDFGITRLQEIGMNHFLTVAITTLFFCLLHYGQGWAGIINAAFLGIGLSFWYLKRESLASNIVAHSVFNLMVLTTMTLSN